MIGNYFDQKSLKRKNEALVRENEKVEAAQSGMDAAQEQVQDLASQLQRLNIDLVQTWLKSLSNNFGLDTNDRITVYYEYGRAFFLLARYSKNPEFRRVHRQKFPIDEGVISQAWQHEECVETECPEANEHQAYEDFLVEKYGYKREKPHSFNMKSCRLYAKAIIDAGDNIGVIVFESISDKFLENLDIKNLRMHCEAQQSQLAKFVRDGLRYDKEITLLASARTTSVESELLSGESDE